MLLYIYIYYKQNGDVTPKQTRSLPFQRVIAGAHLRGMYARSLYRERVQPIQNSFAGRVIGQFVYTGSGGYYIRLQITVVS